jgi:hypothetical protein
MGRPAFYMTRGLRSWFRRQVRNSKNVHLTLEEVGGKRVVAFDGIPIRRTDAILQTESTIS